MLVVVDVEVVGAGCCGGCDTVGVLVFVDVEVVDAECCGGCDAVGVLDDDDVVDDRFV